MVTVLPHVMMSFKAAARFVGIVFFLLLQGRVATAQFGFVAGDYYTSNYFSRSIRQYDDSGTFVGSLTLSPALGDEVQGIAFGSEDLLWRMVARPPGFASTSMNRSGVVQQTYS